MKIILTGATGMVGEGVLMECLNNSAVTKILMVNRRPSPIKDPKLAELIIADFMQSDSFAEALSGYDACFYCAGISSVGMDEAKYTVITYDTTILFAKKLTTLNPDLVFTFVSGSHTDSSERGKIMWARVKGKTENALLKLPFKAVYNFRPGFMKPFKGQKNVKALFKPIIAIFPILFPGKTLSMQEIGQAMINAVEKGFPRHILEIADIRQLANA